MAKAVPTRPLSSAELSEARDLDRRFCEAMGRRDLDAAMACFWDSPDLVLVSDGVVQRGSDAVRDHLERRFALNESVTLQIDEITYLPSGDGVIGVGTATFDIQPAGGPRRLVVERWSDLRRKIDGRWVYVLDHTTIVPR
jgi:ketosteroid isomerase-like protein